VRQAFAWLALAACGASSPPAQPLPSGRVDDGITRCGPPVPPAPAPAPPVKPAREPMPSFTAPRSDASGLLDVEGDLDSEVVSRELRAHADELRACFLHLVALDARTGTMRVELAFAILESGTVAGVEVSGGPPELDACVCERATALRFPAFDGRASVRYPLIFANDR